MRVKKLDSAKELKYKLIPETRSEKSYLMSFSRHYGFMNSNFVLRSQKEKHKAMFFLLNFIIKEASK